jgi:hypothetical protein
MAKLVGTAELIITPEKSVLLVDGEEFPYHIAADDIEIVTLPNGASFFRVSVYAESVQVRADLGARGSFTVDTAAEANTPWGKPGDVIIINGNTPPPDSHILTLEELDVERTDTLIYLVRVPGGEQDKWSWSSGPYDKGLFPVPWREVKNDYQNTRFKIVAVK